jgi:hypothetical protein
MFLLEILATGVFFASIRVRYGALRSFQRKQSFPTRRLNQVQGPSKGEVRSQPGISSRLSETALSLLRRLAVHYDTSSVK